MNLTAWHLRIIEQSSELSLVENLQRLVWPGRETDIVPSHIIHSAVHNGGILIGAFIEQTLVGCVFGFPGLYFTPDGPRPHHYSHMLAVHPEHRNSGLGFALKRAQWQMVRHQGIDRITWTYDPLLSLNAHLNINRLGAVCSNYLVNFYGDMQDQLNVGLPSDRFFVDWWINTRRVFHRLSHRPRRPLNLSLFLSANVPMINLVEFNENGLPVPQQIPAAEALLSMPAIKQGYNLLLVEIPADIQQIKAVQPSLALEWRLHTRLIFQTLFVRGYLVTDLLYQPGNPPRSYYVLSNGDSTLDGVE